MGELIGQLARQVTFRDSKSWMWYIEGITVLLILQIEIILGEGEEL